MQKFREVPCIPCERNLITCVIVVSGDDAFDVDVVRVGVDVIDGNDSVDDDGDRDGDGGDDSDDGDGDGGLLVLLLEVAFVSGVCVVLFATVAVLVQLFCLLFGCRSKPCTPRVNIQ